MQVALARVSVPLSATPPRIAPAFMVVSPTEPVPSKVPPEATVTAPETAPPEATLRMAASEIETALDAPMLPVEPTARVPAETVVAPV